MAKIIGIDAGSNSLGWAIRDIEAEDNQIIDYGVLTFEKGVASEKGNEFPKVQKRTESRGKRRNYHAEKYRKWELLEFLIAKNMCPLTLDELNKWRKYTKGEKREYPQSNNFINWLRFDFNGDGKPDFQLLGKDKNESYYVFRAYVVDENLRNVYRDNPHILGRVFYQLVQRRGFRGRDEEEAKTMLQGSDKTGTKGRNDIAEYIEKHKTLGSALYHYQKENGGRIRQRYNLRKDYDNELKEICKVQRISEEDYKKLAKAIIWQRPLRTQKGLVGMCIYEKNKKRVQVSHPLYEEYRTWIFINNLNIIPPFQEELQDYLLSNIYPLFYRASNDFELKVIDKQLCKDGAKRLSKHSEKTKVVSAKLLKSFQDLLGDDWREKYGWNSINEREAQPKKKTRQGYTFEDIWHVLNTFDGQENLKSFAVEKLKLDEEKAEKFSKIKLNKGYATLSLSAIKKILPFLQKGFLYSQAVYLANLYKVLGADKITDDLIEYFAGEVKTIIDKNKEEKTLNNIVNSLVQEESNSVQRYSIEVDRELDDEELRQIQSNMIDVFGEKTWSTFDEEKQQVYFDYVAVKFKEFLKKSVLSKHNVFINQPCLHDQIFALIQEKYQVPKENQKHLWHPSEQESYVSASEYYHFKTKGKDVFISENDKETFVKRNPDADFQGTSLKLLGSPEPISKGFKNPMAMKSLYKLKHLLNYLLQTEKIDEDTRVVVEIARELNNANKRKAIERWNNERERENEAFKKKIREINKECGTNFDENDKTLIRKIRLWEEQGRQCLYTGKMIQSCDVFDGSKYDIEHTIPASISFDSELKNLTLADTDFNRNEKGKKFPTQLPNYDEIKPRLKFMEEKVEHLDSLFKEWKNKASFASTKDVKDACIQRYHLIQMDLDYWRAKLHTFTLEEYKVGWKNSQLRDTQIVTKYALPYLKTVFKRVSVEKGSVTSIFREIYEVVPKDKLKDRSVHSHHAIDAAILTLIPPFYDRDKILAKYNEEKDRKTGKIYHEKPKDWKDFKTSHILNIENKIFINNLLENKTTIPTFKAVRKKGKIVWIDKANNVKKVAQGDTIRGQLHGESLYGAIKLPKRNEQNQILFDENQRMILEETPILVIRKDLVYKKDANSPGFKTLEEIEKVIVDKDLFQMIKKQVEEAPDFKTALTNGVYMIDRKGNKVNRIRRIRCKESMKYDTAIKVHPHNFISDKEYKHFTLAKNGENALCLFYMNDRAKAMNILSISQVAELKFQRDQQYFDEPYYSQIETGKGKKKSTVPLYAVLRTGQKVLFYKDSMEELKEFSKDGQLDEISKRLFKIYQFESDGRIKFRHHLAAGIDTELKKENKEYSSFNVEDNPVFLRLSQANWGFAIEGKDFEMKLDGTIEFKF